LRRALATISGDATARSVASWFARIALQVCCERAAVCIGASTAAMNTLAA
jgi:hypothetical protein